MTQASLSSDTSSSLNGTEEESFISTFFVRALYDYQSKDPSSLSFYRNDIIEVLTRLDSGWWDGLLGEERGWFPSNYVAVISAQEAEAVLGVLEGTASIAPSATGESVVSMTDIMSGHVPREQESEWSDIAADTGNGKTGINRSPSSANSHTDFWVPQVTADGQVCCRYLLCAPKYSWRI
jgi:son of sevenless-like protein